MSKTIFPFNKNFARDQIFKELEKFKDEKKREEIIIAAGFGNRYKYDVRRKKEDFPSLPAVAAFAKVFNKPIDYFIYEGKIFIELIKNKFIQIRYIESSTDSNNCLIYKNNEAMYAMRYEWLNKISADPTNLVLFTIDSDAMETTLNKGDEVLIDTSKEAKQIKDSMLYAYNSSAFKYIRIRRFSIQVNNIKLIADNKIKYDSCIANLIDINIIGQVICAKHILL